MTLLWGVVGYVLYLYLILVLARAVIDTARVWARKWRPAGVAAVGVEAVYVATDPPIRLFRRWVPPLQLGSVSLDLSVFLLILILIVLQQVVASLA
jgi:YggT family protein